MTLGETLVAVWRQVLVEGKAVVKLNGESCAVKRTRGKNLRTIQFTYGDYRIDGIEQNPQTSSRWAALAREGNRVMQFSCQGRYVGNVCEEKVLRYPAWGALRLPE